MSPHHGLRRCGVSSLPTWSCRPRRSLRGHRPHRPGRTIRSIERNRRALSGGDRLAPLELGAVHPDAVLDHRDFPGDRDSRLARANPLREPHAPGTSGVIDLEHADKQFGMKRRPSEHAEDAGGLSSNKPADKLRTCRTWMAECGRQRGQDADFRSSDRVAVRPIRRMPRKITS